MARAVAALTAACALVAAAPAQWQLIDPPHPGEIEAFGVADGDPDIVYVATNPDGAWETADGGATDLLWLFSGMGLYEVHMTATPIAPGNNWRRYTMSVGGGIQTTANGGASWTAGTVPSGQGRHRPWVSLAIAPPDDSEIEPVVLAGGDGVIRRSTDAARSWAGTTGVPNDVIVTDIEYVHGPGAAGSVWAATSDCAMWEERQCADLFSGQGRGVLGSIDGGQSWAQILIDSVATHPKNFVNAVATIPGQPFYLLAGTDDGLWATVDAGATWVDYTPPGLSPRRVTDVAYASSPNPTIYIGTEVGVWRGDVSGGSITWTHLNSSFPVDFVTAITTTVNTSDLLYAGYRHGDTWKTTDAGATASEIHGAHGAYPIATIAIQSNDEQLIYIGTVCQQGVFKGAIPSAGNPAWAVLERNGNHFHYVMRLAQNPDDGNIAYATENNWIWGTGDAGLTWRLLTPPPPDEDPLHLHGLAIAPSNTARLYLGTGHGNWGSHTDTYHVWRSDNYGFNWTDVTNNFPQPGTETSLFDIAVSPANDQIVYIATFGSENYPPYPGQIIDGDGQGMVRSLDGGQTWTQVNAGLAASPNNLSWWVGRVAMRVRSGILVTYIATLDGLYKMVGAGGSTWQDISPAGGPRRFESIAVDPVNGNILYAGTSETDTSGPARIYRSIDAGQNWTQMSIQMEPLAWSAQYRVRDIQVGVSRAYAAVEGSGVYLLDGPDLEEVRAVAVEDGQ